MRATTNRLLLLLFFFFCACSNIEAFSNVSWGRPRQLLLQEVRAKKQEGGGGSSSFMNYPSVRYNTRSTRRMMTNHHHHNMVPYDEETAIPRQQRLIEKGSPDRNNKSIFELLAEALSQGSAAKVNAPYNDQGDKMYVQILTLLRVGIPSLAAGVAAYFLFPAFALFLASITNDAGVFAVLSQDSSQFVQNFLTVTGLLFSILVGQTYYFMYQQQEAMYYALFNEVTEAKSLLEQVALVCQGRSMYKQVLTYIKNYVEYDLKQLQCDPAVLLSARPVDDPLESIMYMTSVGVPSSVYETVRSLRQARATRLGALQRKLPKVHMILLWMLALIELVSFPLLGAGTQTIGGYRILTVEGGLFGIMTFGIVMTLRVVGELWRPAGGAYNVDGVLSVMVRGLEEELDARQISMKEGTFYGNNAPGPDGAGKYITITAEELANGNQLTDTRLSSSRSSSSREKMLVQEQGAGGGLKNLSKKLVRKIARRIIANEDESEEKTN